MGIRAIAERFLGGHPSRGRPPNRSPGSYWCPACNHRLPDPDGPRRDPVDCPECGTTMEFDRGGPSHCAC